MKLALAALLLAMPFAAKAGDPCPIPVEVHDLGVPHWLDRDEVLDGLESREAWLGIRYAFGPDGLTLTHVHDGSPADGAGLVAGDLLRSINNAPVGLPDQTGDAFETLIAGEEALITLIRSGEGLIDVSLTVGFTDPVPIGMVHALNEQDCREAVLAASGQADLTDLMEALFNANRGFRCEEAHIALAANAPVHAVDDVYVVRGSRRILITMPHWGSTCLAARDLDGAALTDAALVAAIDRVIAGYVADRHANP